MTKPKKITPTYGYAFAPKPYVPSGEQTVARSDHDDLFQRDDYSPGDGDVVAVRRPGSDHSHIKSWGFRC